jgi:two-component system, HptB-dependent secretion and biofilm response regulator
MEFLNKPIQIDELVARVGAIAAMSNMHNTLVANQEETLGEISIVKHLLERLTEPGLKLMPSCFAMETLQTQRINGDASSYRMGIGGTHFGLLCDATGHGLVAGISTLPVIETFQVMASRDIPLESIYQEINAKVCRLLPADRYTCLIMLRLDPEVGLLRVLNAGMPDIFLLRRGGEELRRFSSKNFPAGIQVNPDAVEVEDVSVSPGDRIFAFSDGLWDLVRESIIQKMFLRRGTRFPVAVDHAWLKSVLMRSLKNAEQHDDLTWALWEVPPPTPLAMEAEPAIAHEAGRREGLVLQFEMDPRVHQVRDLVPNILGLLGFKGVPSPALQTLGILLTEAFDNAVDHGLLTMDSSVKSKGFEIYEARRREALSAFQGGMARCRLSLRYGEEIPPVLHQIEIEVSDDGPGFDWDSILHSCSPDLLAPYGRGIPLMKALAPDFRFNEAGNAVLFSVPC